MTALSLPELRSLAQSVRFPASAVVDGAIMDVPALAAAVAMAESGGDPNAYGDAQYGGSIGLWQVNLPAHPEYTESELYDPTTNAQAALAISSQGTNWTPWTTYRTGAYKPYYQPSSSAGRGAGGAGVVLGVLALGGGAVLALVPEARALVVEGARAAWRALR